MTYGRKVGRFLFVSALVLTLFAPAIQFTAGPVTAGVLVALGVGVAAQVTATVLLVRWVHAGLAVAVGSTVVMLLVESPWQGLFAVQAVPWVPLVLMWATARVIDKSTAPGQLWWSAGLVVAYLVAVAVHADREGLPVVPLITAGAALPVLGGACASFAARLSWARVDRMETLAAERDAVRRRGQAERDRQLATELHDTLGHQLTLLVLHANTMLVTTADDGAKGSATQIARLGNDALTDLRRLSDLLADGERRAETASRTERTGPDLRELIREAEQAGQRIEVRRFDDLTGVPMPQAAALHRALQEGLSNARTHGPHATVEIEVARAAAELAVTVRNESEAGPVGRRGLGLVGLRRRVELLGGALAAGEDQAGGYVLRVSIPLPVASIGGGEGTAG